MVPVKDLLAACQKYGERPAIVICGVTLDYNGLAERISRQAKELTRHLSSGDRIALLCGNTLDFITLSLAAELIGAIRVPLNIKATPAEIAALLADCSPKLVVYEAETEGLLAQAPAIKAIEAATLASISDDSYTNSDALSPAARCSITYTSGSTGKPKGVVLTHANWHYVFANMLIDRDISATDTLAFIGPLTHAGWSYLYAGLLRGARAAVFDAGDVDAMLAFAQQDEITIITCVPTTLSRIIKGVGNHHPLCQSLKWIGVGGAPTSPALLERAISIFGRRVVLNFGQTEAMMTCAFYNLAREQQHDHEAGLIGRSYIFSSVAIRAEDGTACAIGEVGEICVSGPHTMLEYWNNPQQTAAAYRRNEILTGDLGVEIAPGLFRLVGRAKDMIISGGFNIYPMEVEAAVAALPEVDEVAVMGISDEEWGEKVVCVLSAQQGAELSVDRLRQSLKPVLGIKTPKVFHLLPQLPKAATGKIDKKALKIWLEEQGQ
ncbi:class I adenylate-forming enzyme family protein [Brucella gallinifaecis]|uniref:Long-chain fatty acid--CoA ligase n=1 Tax=Brucella gallinifaecis TaxID=215590 RepID=A0A502BLM5_9HYPH|nr:AMP-binding protein [Brucella gallinifaecis]TPF74278.1 long-chain fatty acid--CoA ligase [Brucella gallinifaecis]